MRVGGSGNFINTLIVSGLAFALRAPQSYVSMHAEVGDDRIVGDFVGSVSLITDVAFLSLISVFIWVLPIMYLSFSVSKPAKKITAVPLCLVYNSAYQWI